MKTVFISDGHVRFWAGFPGDPVLQLLRQNLAVQMSKHLDSRNSRIGFKTSDTLSLVRRSAAMALVSYPQKVQRKALRAHRRGVPDQPTNHPLYARPHSKTCTPLVLGHVDNEMYKLLEPFALVRRGSNLNGVRSGRLPYAQIYERRNDMLVQKIPCIYECLGCILGQLSKACNSFMCGGVSTDCVDCQVLGERSQRN